jgi:hypothetical protein
MNTSTSKLLSLCFVSASLKRVIEKTLKDWTELFAKPPKDKSPFVATKPVSADLPSCK